MHRRPLPRLAALACAAGCALVLGLPLPTAASAAPPLAATLVSPPDGGVTASVSPTLSVTASDPDGGSVDVAFEGRVAGATVPGATDAAPFTVVVVPDTQNYSDGRQALLETQLRWVRDSRAELGTAFVVQVGDLVGDWFIERQWNNVSTAFDILDAAAVPNSVLPGNHDFDNATGDVAPYNSHFGPTRYATGSWNTATTRYGGHLGLHQFGPDGIDRGNADSYSLFTAGGRDFLVLSLEWEAPGYALEWADRVLDAHPDRTVIMATHSFLTVNGTRLTTPQRPGGTAPAQLWQDFVRTHCQIRLVVAGHENQGDLGEARRTDDNACGQPVHQILSNYQARANGGDGWLRYYTFDPAASTMRATTYSPTLERFETDADSAFTLPFELSTPQPAPFRPIGTRTVPSGTNASVEWTGLEHDEEYEWRAVVGDGTDSTASAAWTLRTPPVPQQTIAADAFSRVVSNGWGSADTGGAWTASGGSAAFSVSGGRGVMTLAPSHTREARLPAVSATDVVVDVQVSSDVASIGGTTSATLVGRAVGASSYALSVRFQPNGVLRSYLLRDGTGLATAVSTWAPGQLLRARLWLTGTSPTQLSAKVWLQAGTEPAAWQMTATDATPALQTAGAVTIRSAVSASSSVPTTRLSYDEYRVIAPGAPSANAAPTAAFTVSSSNLAVAADASGSSDGDGTVVAYAWDFGDGGTASGVRAAHTYAAAGDYTVRLTVTDDDGATATTSRSVRVAAPPPPPQNEAPVAAIATPRVDGRTVSLDGRSSSDADGTITAHAWDFGDGQSAAGATASHTYAADGTFTVRLTVTDDDGATGTATLSVTVSAPPPPPGGAAIAADAFERTVSGGWGSADVGGAWTATGGSSSYSVGGGDGVVALRPADTREARLLGVTTTSADVTVAISADTASVGGTASATVVGRLVGSSIYSARLRLEPGGTIRLYLLRDQVLLRSHVLAGSYTAGEEVMLRLSVTGTSPTALSAKIWRAGSAEPAGWQVQATDATAALQTAGSLSLHSYISSASTVPLTRLRYDDYRVTAG